MPNAKTASAVEPVPRYINPDHSAPDYETIMRELATSPSSQIGSSYYYIRSDANLQALCRIIPGGGRIFFHEIVRHEQHGISDGDIEESVQFDQGSFSMPGHYRISPLIEAKLRALYDA